MEKLPREVYAISRDTLEKVLDALRNHWFYRTDSGEEHNNDDIIDAQYELEREIENYSDEEEE